MDNRPLQSVACNEYTRNMSSVLEGNIRKQKQCECLDVMLAFGQLFEDRKTTASEEQEAANMFALVELYLLKFDHEIHQVLAMISI